MCWRGLPPCEGGIGDLSLTLTKGGLMRIEKELYIQRFEAWGSGYTLKVGGGLEAESTLTFDAQTLEEFAIPCSPHLVGKRLRLILSSMEGPEKNRVFLHHLEKREERIYRFSTKRPETFDRVRYMIHASTPTAGGTLVVLPCPYYDLHLELSEEEYERLRALPPQETEMQVGLSLIEGR